MLISSCGNYLTFGKEARNLPRMQISQGDVLNTLTRGARGLSFFFWEELDEQ